MRSRKSIRNHINELIVLIYSESNPKSPRQLRQKLTTIYQDESNTYQNK